MYLKDPSTGLPSVSLTFLMISFLLAAGFSIASVLDQSKNPGPLMELFYACAALYFGRKMNIGGKNFSGKEDSSGTSEQDLK